MDICWDKDVVFDFDDENNILKYHYDFEEVWIQAWGDNSLRVRATKLNSFPDENWALTMPVKKNDVEVNICENYAVIKNGKIQAKMTKLGKLSFLKENGEEFLVEYLKNRRDRVSPDCSALDIDAREFKPILGGDYKLTMRFVSTPNEKIYGMGQYQQPYLDLKGSDLELAQRNSQASVPFALSSLGYGFLWNNPAVGRVVFGKNITSWEAYSTKALDYWITVGDSPSEIEESYAKVTGTVPMMPEYAMGFWQCKLRYQTQEELLNVAREYKKRGLPISVIVVDYFHWPYQGDWRFDEDYWPNPDAMIKELKEMGIELMVSIWPTVDNRSENYNEMLEKGYLIKTELGFRLAIPFHGNTIHYDATNPAARNYVWKVAKKNYYDKGVKIFWLDEAEPEYKVYDFENYRYHIGPNVQIGNVYPVMYAQTFYEGMKAEGQENVINLLRCAWAGSQKFGALVWSGDIFSSFASLRNQIVAGLNMGISGIPWWTTDIGGFHGGYPDDPKFQELLIRWFCYGTFCPVMRLHGERRPLKAPMGTEHGATCVSGVDNEVWSFGDKAYEVLTNHLRLREKMKSYITELMEAAHKKGTPVIRPLFYDFPKDKKAWEIEDQYMFGPDVLVAPVYTAAQREREVYLPNGEWRNLFTNELITGGQTIVAPAPIENIPVFMRNGRVF